MMQSALFHSHARIARAPLSLALSRKGRGDI